MANITPLVKGERAAEGGEGIQINATKTYFNKKRNVKNYSHANRLYNCCVKH